MNKIKLKDIKTQRGVKTKNSMWSNDERRQYLLFIGTWKGTFTEKIIDPEIYVQMQKFIGSQKTAYDCYSLHDRMKKKYKNYDNIVQNLAQVCNVKIEDILSKRQKASEIKKLFFSKILQQSDKKIKQLLHSDQKQNQLKVEKEQNQCKNEHIDSNNQKQVIQPQNKQKTDIKIQAQVYQSTKFKIKRKSIILINLTMLPNNEQKQQKA